MFFKDKIAYIIIGFLLAVIVVLGYSFFSLGKTVSSDHSVLVQIVSLINKSQASAPPAAAPVK
jgi:predicted negative regulator of RcsB-dependent stress response